MSWEPDAVWEEVDNPDAKLRVIEERGDDRVLVERFGVILPGQSRQPFVISKRNVTLVFTPTDRRRGPVT